MAKEIERKFMVVDDGYRSISIGRRAICQAYLSARPEATVRVRILQADDDAPKAYLTVKGPNDGAVRYEWEYEIPETDARSMMTRLSCEGSIVEKVRYIVPYGGLVWEVDEFASPCAGLTVAEVEIPDADMEISMPPFVGREVTGDPKYYNSSMAVSGSL